jgi:phage terminase large subunit
MNPVIDFTINADKLFTKVFHDYRRVKSRYMVLRGGAGSSKSYSAHQAELINIMQHGTGNTLVLRKHSSDLRNSCFELFCNLIDRYNLTPFFRRTYSGDNRQIVYNPTGRKLVFRGVDDPEKLKSIVGFKRVLIEEANQLEFDDFKEVTRRVRGMDDIQIILILNPVSEDHWIKKQMCDPDGGYYPDTTELSYTYHVNPYMTDQDIVELERMKLLDINQYRIYVLNEWGVVNKERKYAYAFDITNHVRSHVEDTMKEVYGLPYKPQDPLWLSFDFNVDPMSCTVAQHINDTLYVLRCIKLNNSNTSAMCDVIKAMYPSAIYKVTGDASGRNTSTVGDNIHNYQIIQSKLNLTNSQLVVPNTNPKISLNRVLLNAVLMNVDVMIDADNCKPLISDLTYVEVNREGEILKDRTSETTKSDFLDNFRYLVNVLFPDLKKIIK